MNTMGTKIRRARVRLALTLDELAHKTGISKAYLSLIETGRLANPPSDDKLRRLAEAVGLPANELVGRAHVQRIPPDVRALLDELMTRPSGHPLGGPGPLGGAGSPGDRSVPNRSLRGGGVAGDAANGDAAGTRQADAGAGKSARPGESARAGAAAADPGGRPKAGRHGLPLNLDAAYRSGVLQELADRNGGGGNVEVVPWAGPGAVAGGGAGLASGPVGLGVLASRVDVSAAGPWSAAGGGCPLIPIVNKVSAGYPRDFTDLSYPPRVADAYIAAPGIDDPDAFAARVSGDSMTPKYAEGDIVLFSPAAAWKDGADCFVRFEDGQTTFKRVYADWTPDDREALRLQPRNDRYEPRVVPREQVTGVYRAVSVYRALDGE